MLDLVTVSPIQWGKQRQAKTSGGILTPVVFLDIKINQNSIAPQSEITVTCGSRITIDINISNNQATTLHNLILSVQFYQDFQNGMQNYRLETRTCSSGPNWYVPQPIHESLMSPFYFYLSSTLIPALSKGENSTHEFSALFFTRGRFKVDIQCKNEPRFGQLPSSVHPPVTNDTHHVYKFIPSIEITVN